MRVLHGVIENVLVQVDKFIFSMDFIVMDMEPRRSDRRQISIIIGRPFLVTANATINCRTRVMDVSFGNMEVLMNIF